MGARLVKDINPAGSSSPNELISINGLLFFSAEVSATVPTKGNSAVEQEDSEESIDTELEKDIPNSSDEAEAETPNPSTDTQPSGGVGLMRSDGSDSGTTILKLFDSVSNFVKSGDKLYFIAGINNQYQLWSSDGTSRGTKQVKDLYPNADPNFPQDLFEIDGVLFYAANNTNTDEGIPAENGYELWRREGNGIGTPMFKNLIPDQIITEATIEIEEDEETGIPETTTTLTTKKVQNDSFPRDFTGVNGNLFFVAATPYFMEEEDAQEDFLNIRDRDIIGGFELWFSDGTESGTRPILINSNLYNYYAPGDIKYGYIPPNLYSEDYGFTTNSSSSFPRELTPTTKKLYFVANDGVSGFELWSVNDQGTKPSLISDLNPGNRSSSPEELTFIGKNLYFSADQGNGRKLFYYNKSFNKPKLVKNSGDNPESLTAVGKYLYYSAESELGRELWSAQKTNGKMVHDINPGSASSSPSEMTMITRIDGNKPQKREMKYLYFSADDGSHGIELMSINLKSKKNKVSISADLISGPPSSFPRELINHDQQLYFTAKNQSKGRELWTVGPAIEGPTGEPGASSSEVNIFEKQTFVYKFSQAGSQKSRWEINGGEDAACFTINTTNGKLSFKSAPKYRKPKDQNKDNIYDVFVRSTIKSNGYNSDQLVSITVATINEDSESDNNNPVPDENDNSESDNNNPVPDENDSSLNENNSSDKILFYTDECGPITANGALYPCDQSNSDPITGVSGSDSGGSDPDSSNYIPPVNGNSDLKKGEKENYNNYNVNVERYKRFDEDCDWASSARRYAIDQLGENDDTLAQHYNTYFAPICDTSQILI